MYFIRQRVRTMRNSVMNVPNFHSEGLNPLDRLIFTHFLTLYYMNCTFRRIIFVREFAELITYLPSIRKIEL